MSKKPKLSNIAVVKSPTNEELLKIAKNGTKEAIDVLDKYFKAETNSEKKNQITMVRKECEFLYYLPKSQKEEDDFYLCKLIQLRQEIVNELKEKREQIEEKEYISGLENRVHQRMKTKTGSEKENNRDSVLINHQAQLLDIKNKIAYHQFFILEAKKMITTLRYKTIPRYHIEEFNFLSTEKPNMNNCKCQDSH